MAGEPDDVDTMVEPVVPSRHRWLAGLLGAGPGDRVVDLGCGTITCWTRSSRRSTAAASGSASAG
jgi:hypothetical protein